MSGRPRRQLNPAQLFEMSYRAIELAVLEGRCDELLDIPAAPARPDQTKRKDIDDE